MRTALAYEWQRITTVRSTYWFSAMAVVVSGMTAFFIALAFRASDLTADGVSTFFQASTLVVTAAGSVFIAPVVSAPFCAVIGAMSFGHEYRYGTIKQTLTAIPDRVVMFFAKLVILVGWLLTLMLVIVVVNMAMGGLFLDGFSLSQEALRPIVDFALYNVGWGIAGFGLAALFRNLAGALVGVLVYPLVIEAIGYNILRLVKVGTLDRLANLFPASAGRRTIFSPYERFANPSSSSDTTLHVWGLAASTAVFWCGLLLLTATALALFLARDA
ncbi:MAG: ABC transporter permease [Actinomycetota bacterium]|nr:ABC transporter permease [Actinomycetota bacterium]